MVTNEAETNTAMPVQNGATLPNELLERNDLDELLRSAFEVRRTAAKLEPGSSIPERSSGDKIQDQRAGEGPGAYSQSNITGPRKPQERRDESS